MSDCTYHVKKRTKRSDTGIPKFTTAEYQKKVDSVFDVGKYTLLGIYQGATSKIDVLCLCGHLFEARPIGLLSGNNGCINCQINKSKLSSSINDILVENFGLNMLSVIGGEYESVRSIIEFQCVPCNLTFNGKFANVRNTGCPNCKSGRIIKGKTLSKSQVQNKLDKKYGDIKIVGDYVNTKTPVLLEHSCGHIFIKRIDRLYNTCPKCNRSKGEKEVAAFIKEIYNGLVIENDRTILKPKELDVYLPDIGFAVEYNGDYWHNKKPVGYHSGKTDNCKKRGITLLHVWESDWKADKDLWKHKIQEVLLLAIQSALPI